LNGGSTRHNASVYKAQHDTKKRGRTYLPRAWFEPTIPVSERSNTVRIIDRAAISTGRNPTCRNICREQNEMKQNTAKVAFTENVAVTGDFYRMLASVSDSCRVRYLLDASFCQASVLFYAFFVVVV